MSTVTHHARHHQVFTARLALIQRHRQEVAERQALVEAAKHSDPAIRHAALEKLTGARVAPPLSKASR